MCGRGRNCPFIHSTGLPSKPTTINDDSGTEGKGKSKKSSKSDSKEAAGKSKGAKVGEPKPKTKLAPKEALTQQEINRGLSKIWARNQGGS